MRRVLLPSFVKLPVAGSCLRWCSTHHAQQGRAQEDELHHDLTKHQEDSIKHQKMDAPFTPFSPDRFASRRSDVQRKLRELLTAQERKSQAKRKTEDQQASTLIPFTQTRKVKVLNSHRPGGGEEEEFVNVYRSFHCVSCDNPIFDDAELLTASSFVGWPTMRLRRADMEVAMGLDLRGEPVPFKIVSTVQSQRVHAYENENREKPKGELEAETRDRIVGTDSVLAGRAQGGLRSLEQNTLDSSAKEPFSAKSLMDECFNSQQSMGSSQRYSRVLAKGARLKETGHENEAVTMSSSSVTARSILPRRSVSCAPAESLKLTDTAWVSRSRQSQTGERKLNYLEKTAEEKERWKHMMTSKPHRAMRYSAQMPFLAKVHAADATSSLSTVCGQCGAYLGLVCGSERRGKKHKFDAEDKLNPLRVTFNPTSLIDVFHAKPPRLRKPQPGDVMEERQQEFLDKDKEAIPDLWM